MIGADIWSATQLCARSLAEEHADVRLELSCPVNVLVCRSCAMTADEQTTAKTARKVRESFILKFLSLVDILKDITLAHLKLVFEELKKQIFEKASAGTRCIARKAQL